jgi:3'-phosphoadenosine 5'-phosphosulfate sulfotransferase (PAPS reductase)/FAD synthetase
MFDSKMINNQIIIVSVSGGKDSTALYLLCVHYFGNNFIAIFADTGNEHPVTINYVKNLHHMTGGPEVIIAKANFQKQIERKRKNLIKSIEKSDSVEEVRLIYKKIQRCKFTDRPFHDLLTWKGRAPSTKAQFCTEHLKLWPILFYLEKHYPKQEYKWEMMTGIRAGESAGRAKKQPFSWNTFFDCEAVLPMLYESEDMVYLMHYQNGIEPNALYKSGAKRVGCYPCINSGKEELRNLEGWAWDKLNEFEDCTGGRSWFAPGRVPGIYIPSITDVREWAKTTRGGSQYGLFLQEETEDTPSCMTGFMSCE